MGKVQRVYLFFRGRSRVLVATGGSGATFSRPVKKVASVLVMSDERQGAKTLSKNRQEKKGLMPLYFLAF
jgi:hypothetical protein